MTSFLALDLATRLGWAHWAPGLLVPVSGARQDAGHSNLGLFLDRYERWLLDKMAALDPEIVVFEAPIVSKKTTLAVTRKLFYLQAVTELCCRRPVGRRCFSANVGAIRAHFVGSAKGKSDVIKRLIQDQCRRRNWPFADDNEADALAVLDYTLAQMTKELARANAVVPWRTGYLGPLFERN